MRGTSPITEQQIFLHSNRQLPLGKQAKNRFGKCDGALTLNTRLKSCRMQLKLDVAFYFVASASFPCTSCACGQ